MCSRHKLEENVALLVCSVCVFSSFPLRLLLSCLFPMFPMLFLLLSSFFLAFPMLVLGLPFGAGGSVNCGPGMPCRLILRSSTTAGAMVSCSGKGTRVVHKGGAHNFAEKKNM